MGYLLLFLVFYVCLVNQQEIKEAMAAVVGGVDQGWINPVVGKEYPLEKAPEAHLDIIEGKAKGKMVLNVS